MEQKETKVKQAGKAPRARASSTGFEALRREAARQLRERLDSGELSTADLMKVMNMEPPETEKAKPPEGEWVLCVGGKE